MAPEKQTVLETAPVLCCCPWVVRRNTEALSYRVIPYLLNGFESDNLEAVDAGVQVLRNFSNQPVKRRFPDENYGGLLVLSDLSQGNLACFDDIRHKRVQDMVQRMPVRGMA